MSKTKPVYDISTLKQTLRHNSRILKMSGFQMLRERPSEMYFFIDKSKPEYKKIKKGPGIIVVEEHGFTLRASEVIKTTEYDIAYLHITFDRKDYQEVFQFLCPLRPELQGSTQIETLILQEIQMIVTTLRDTHEIYTENTPDVTECCAIVASRLRPGIARRLGVFGGSQNNGSVQDLPQNKPMT